MTDKEVIKKMYQLLLTEPHAPTLCDQLESIAREALAQPEQEPVAWMSPSWIDPDTRGWQSDSFESIPIEGWLPIYTTPPQRTWVDLSEQQRNDIEDACEMIIGKPAFDLIDATLKANNK
jgi:hypothetical protein